MKKYIAIATVMLAVIFSGFASKASEKDAIDIRDIIQISANSVDADKTGIVARIKSSDYKVVSMRSYPPAISYGCYPGNHLCRNQYGDWCCPSGTSCAYKKGLCN